MAAATLRTAALPGVGGVLRARDEDFVVEELPAYGPSGEGFVRLSMTVPDKRLEEAARRIESSLRSGIITA